MNTPDKQWNPVLGRWENPIDHTYYDPGSRTWLPMLIAETGPPTPGPLTGPPMISRTTAPTASADRRKAVAWVAVLVGVIAVLAGVRAALDDDTEAPVTPPPTTEEMFVREVQDMGFVSYRSYGSQDHDMLELGYATCEDLEYGSPEAVARGIVYHNTATGDGTITLGDARAFVEAADYWLC